MWHQRLSTSSDANVSRRVASSTPKTVLRSALSPLRAALSERNDPSDLFVATDSRFSPSHTRRDQLTIRRLLTVTNYSRTPIRAALVTIVEAFSMKASFVKIPYGRAASKGGATWQGHREF